MNKQIISPFKRWMCLLCLLGIAVLPVSAALRGEYWLDSDPGHGKATAFTPSTTTNLNIPTNSITDGWHLLGMRVKNNTTWSQTYLYMFYADSYGPNEISAVEYFIDNDPGIGNASAAPFSPSSTSVAFSLNQLDTLPTGYHTLGLRAKRGGMWSFTYKRRFMNINAGIQMNVENVIAWWDNDTENTVSVPFTMQDGVAVISNHIMDAGALTYGMHILHLRATADKQESATYSFEVCKNAIPHFSVLQDTICLGDELIILDESQDVQPETTYAWDVDGNGTTDYTDKGDMLHTFTKAGKYNVTLTLKTGEGCESVYSHEVVVLSKTAPSVSLARTKSKICAGESVTFTATPTNGGDQPLYTWMRNGVVIAGATEAVLTLDDLQDKDTIQVQLTTSNRCAETKTALSSKLIQTVYALPEIEFTLAETYYTDENAFSLTGKATPAGGTFYINEAEVKLFNPKTNAVGTYSVRYVVTNSNGCTAEAEMTFELKERSDDPTAVENITDTTAPRKILINDQIYILRDEKVYTVTGQEVK